MKIEFQTQNDELLFLGSLLHQSALYAQAKANALPENASPEIEMSVVETASTSAFALAEQIAKLEAITDEAIAIKARAAAWCDGTYWQN